MGEVEKTIAHPVWRSGAPSPILLIKRKKIVVGRVALDRFAATLGRAPECDIVLDDCGGVSRTHAQLLVLDGEVVIEDLNSRNGVMVNRKPIKRHTLRPGDRIAIGEYRLHVIYEQGDRLDRPEAESDTAELMRLWAAAAITGRTDSCGLCSAPLQPDAQLSQQPEPEQANHEQCEVNHAPAPGRKPESIRPALRQKLRRRLTVRRGLSRID